jgi:Kef-type K+ transport system membrane component KefB
MHSFTALYLILGSLLLAGLLAGLGASRFGFPRVVAYVISGMLFSHSLLGGVLNISVGEWAEPLTTVALGIIAYIIGGSITIRQLRRTGRVILGSMLGEALGAVLMVFVAVLLVVPGRIDGLSGIHLALAFGAIAASTAPAATLAVLHQYRAHGPLATTLLGVVALDDALGIILFAFMIVLTTGASFTASLASAGVDIAGSVAIGAVCGYVLSRLARHVHQGSLRLPLVLASVLLVLGLAEYSGMSPLLAAMTLGFASRNILGTAGDRLFTPVEYFEELVFLVFFTVAGAHFEPRVFIDYLDLIAVYVVARLLGKVSGAALGARFSGAPQSVVRWLGAGLVPQAGVAVGLALTLGHQPLFREVSHIIVNVILGTTLLFELLGPFAVRLALTGAGETGPRRERERI